MYVYMVTCCCDVMYVFVRMDRRAYAVIFIVYMFACLLAHLLMSLICLTVRRVFDTQTIYTLIVLNFESVVQQASTDFDQYMGKL